MTAGLRERTAATAASSLAGERPWSNSVFGESGKFSGSARRRAVSRPMPSDEPVRRMTLPMGWDATDSGEEEMDEEMEEEAKMLGGGERSCEERGEKKRRRGERDGGQKRGCTLANVDEVKMNARGNSMDDMVIFNAIIRWN